MTKDLLVNDDVRRQYDCKSRNAECLSSPLNNQLQVWNGIIGIIVVSVNLDEFTRFCTDIQISPLGDWPTRSSVGAPR